MECPSLSRHTENKKSELLFLLPFVLLSASTDWISGTHMEEGNLLYSAHRFKC